ncbi:MAG TPA: peptidoglycan D,D-transpeptidase FtsI family protein [Candidatus Hypogeohydataceae bacterium YC41]
MYPNRLKILFVLIAVFHLALVGRLAQLQLIEGGKYSGLSKKRLVKEHTLTARRGSIYDRNGRPLALEETAFDIEVLYKNFFYSCYASRNELPEPLYQSRAHKKAYSGRSESEGKEITCQECHLNDGLWVERVARLLDTEPSELLKKAEEVVKRVESIKKSVQEGRKKTVRVQEEMAYHPIVKNIPIEKAVELEARLEQYPGVSLAARPRRYYPNGDWACHILGYLGNLSKEEWQKIKTLRTESSDSKLALYYNTLSQDTLVGMAGVEAQYDEKLQGRPGKRIGEIVLKTLKVDKIFFDMPPQAGQDLFLTLDSDLQRLAESALRELGDRNGSIVVMEVNTGEVLAMASYPGFNPNTFNQDFIRLVNDPRKPLLNRPLQASLPPGSTFKPVTALAALAGEDINTSTQFYCGGKLAIGDRTWRCTSTHYRIGLEEALEHSCNVYFYEVAKRLGDRSLESEARAFGLGEKTGIDLPVESSGLVPLTRSLGDRLNFAIGQGEILVTPLQMTRMMAAIANGGKLVRPHLLKKVISLEEEQQWESLDVLQKERSVSILPEHLNALHNALRKVVVSGTAKGKGLDVLEVAGKTGTSQTGLKGVNHAWFIGYMPYNNPRYCVCVVVEDTAGHGGDVAAPIAQQLAQYLINKDAVQLTARRDATVEE